MSYQWPKKPHLGYLATLPFVIAGSFISESATATTWWTTLPFLYIAGIFIAYGVGVWINDIFDSNSWIHNNWREFKKTFDVSTINSIHIQGPPERVDINCVIKFKKNIADEYLTVRVVLPLPARKSRVQVIHHQKIISAAKDSIKHLRLGSISITRPHDPFARHSIWGEILGEQDLKNGEVPIIQAKQMLEIQLGAYIYRVYVDVLQSSREENAYIHLLSEEDFPFRQ